MVALLIETRLVDQELEVDRAEVLKLFIEIRNAVLTYTVTGVAELAVHIVARNEIKRDILSISLTRIAENFKIISLIDTEESAILVALDSFQLF